MQAYSNTSDYPVKNIFRSVDLIFLVTKMKDNDRIVKVLSNQEYADNPELFEGDSPYAHYKMKYVPPYENFSELKNLMLRIKKSTGLRNEFKGIVTVDFYEWIGHEDEDYFDVTLKYLHDHRHIWKYIFTMKDADFEKIKPAINASVHFFKTMIVDKCLFNHKDELNEYLRIKFRCQFIKYEISAIELISDIFTDKDAKNIKSYEKIDMIVQDISEHSPDKTISTKMLIKDLTENRLLLNAFVDKNTIQKILKGRDKQEHEK